MTTNWNPKGWIAILLGLLLHSITFLYVNKPKLFWLYLIASAVSPFIDALYGTYFFYAIPLLCSAHAFYIAKRGPAISHQGWYSKWWGLVPCTLLFLIAIGSAQLFLYDPSRIEMDSMLPTITRNDRIIVSKLGYSFYANLDTTSVKGDIASADLMQPGKLYAFSHPYLDATIISRLIAVPGDSIEIVNNEVILNGSALPISQVSKTDQVTTYEQQLGEHSFQIQLVNSANPINFKRTTIPEKSYFFLGDNRNYWKYSKTWGLFSSNRVMGEVVQYPNRLERQRF